MNRFAEHEQIFEGITPWAGHVPQGYMIDFIGTKIDLRFRQLLGTDLTSSQISSSLPGAQHVTHITNISELPPLRLVSWTGRTIPELPVGPDLWDQFEGLSAKIVEGFEVVPGQQILRLVADGAQGRHALGARFAGLSPGGVYRAIVWIKVEPDVRVMIEARDSVDPNTGKPSNYGLAQLDLRARRIVNTAGDILDSGLEAIGDDWVKLWVDLHSKDEQVFVSIGLLEGPSNRHVFKAAGQAVTFGGFEISPPRVIQTTIPTLQTHEEGWFEFFNWVAAAREARDSFVMMTLGACFGYQAAGCHRTLRALNPMPCKLVIVEPEPQNMNWVRQHLRDNDIDPGEHWLAQMVISDTNEPALFPVGSPGLGAHNCLSTNLPKERRALLDSIIKNRRRTRVLSNIMMRNSTGIMHNVIPGKDYAGEIKYVSSITLGDLLSPFSFVDYIEADLQTSEAVVFPPFIDQITQKVRRIHIGTHGAEIHERMHQLFADAGWDIVFSFLPNMTHHTLMGSFTANDGILTVLNPRLSNRPR